MTSGQTEQLSPSMPSIGSRPSGESGRWEPQDPPALRLSPPGPGRALRRHPFTALAPVVVLVLLGAAIGLTRAPVYTAEAQLTVGSVNVNTASLGGFVAAVQTLSSSYSRAVTANAVVQPLAAQLRTSPNAVAGSLSATSVPESNVLRLDATGSSDHEAVVLANDASAALQRYVEHLGNTGLSTVALLADFRAATQAVDAKLQALRVISRPPASSADPAVRRAEADLEVVKLQQATAAQSYRNAEAAQSSGPLLQTLAPARKATSDRKSKFELYVFVGLIAGLVLGLALALVKTVREYGANTA